jgi:predicted dehydrogenase
MKRGALVGVGNVAVSAHLPGWQGRSGVTLAAAADSQPGGRGAFLNAFPQSRWYADAEELLEREEIEFVDLCTPPQSHAALIQKALERGLHVLCEKPLVLSPSEFAPLASLSRDTQRALVTVHNWKHAPAVRKIGELLKMNVVGDIRKVLWETLRTRPAATADESANWRTDPATAGGGILVDHGWHALSILSAWLPGKPRFVRARLERQGNTPPGIEDTAAVTLDYGAASAEIFLTWTADCRSNRVEIEGTEGILRLEGGRLDLLAGPPDRITETWSLPTLAEGSHHPEWFPPVIDGFLEESTNPSLRGRNLQEAAFCLAVLALARESSRREGQAVPFTPLQ